jgi:O-antigen ligase
MSLAGTLADTANLVASPARRLTVRLRRRLEPRDLAVIGVLLVVALPLAALVTSGSAVVVLLTLLLALIAFVLPLKHSSLFLLVIALPFSIVLGEGSSALTLSPGDIALVVFGIAVLGTLSRGALAGERGDAGLRVAWMYAWAFVVLGIFSLLSIYLLHSSANPDLLYSAFSAVKIVVVMVYLLAVLHYLHHSGREGEEYLLRTWSGVSIVIVGVATAVGLLTNIAGVSNGFTSWMMYSYRLQGTMPNPNAFSAYVIISLSVVLAYAAMRGRERAPLLVSTVFMLAVLLTGSRAAFPSLILGGFVVYATGRAIRPFLRRLIPVLLLMFWLMFSLAAQIPGLSALARATEGATQDGQADERFDYWWAAVELWLHNPLFGVGIGQFQVAATELKGFEVRIIPHNTYLSYLSELGTIGFVIALSLPVFVGYRLFRLHRKNDLVASCLLIGLVGFAIQATTLNLENLRPFWVALALMFAYAVRREHEHPPPDGDGVQAEQAVSADAGGPWTRRPRGATEGDR